MSIQQADIEKIAKLARIRIDDSDVPQVAQRINDILAMVDKMQATNTEGVEPIANPLDAFQRLRIDEITETDQRASFQALAPEAEAGLYLVPKVIE